jgi:hypothetical protein
VAAATCEGVVNKIKRRSEAERRCSMRTYERPTLTKAGSFKKVTGLGGSGPRDFAFRHQML